MSRPVLEVRNLCVDIASARVVRGLDLALVAGQTLALVGESGCGKSLSAMAIMGLLPPSVRVGEGSVRLQQRELIGLRERELRNIRGNAMAMIFQDPMSALTPTMRIGEQIAEVLRAHRGLAAHTARTQAVALLERCRIADAPMRARQYPCEFSGGMLQRVMIAIALACRPAVLIADEPTTALDVTIQDQILELIRELQREEGMALLLITHDFGVVARMADEVAVMYAGEVVETGPVAAIFQQPAHPYTAALQRALPRPGADRRIPLDAIAGQPPAPGARRHACSFAPRCPHAMRICGEHSPPALSADSAHRARCWLRHPQAPATATGGQAV